MANPSAQRESITGLVSSVGLPERRPGFDPTTINQLLVPEAGGARIEPIYLQGTIAIVGAPALGHFTVGVYTSNSPAIDREKVTKSGGVPVHKECSTGIWLRDPAPKGDEKVLDDLSQVLFQALVVGKHITRADDDYIEKLAKEHKRSKRVAQTGIVAQIITPIPGFSGILAAQDHKTAFTRRNA